MPKCHCLDEHLLKKHKHQTNIMAGILFEKANLYLHG